VDGIETAARLISNVGFPIFVAVVLLYQVIRMHQATYTTFAQISEEAKRMRAAVESLTALLMRASKLDLEIRE
jgi:hypothetical protein